METEKIIRVTFEITPETAQRLNKCMNDPHYKHTLMQLEYHKQITDSIIIDRLLDA